MRFRKIQIIPLLFIICATLTLGGLGVWQLERLKVKTALEEGVAKAQAEAPMTSIPAAGLPEYHNVKLSGVWLHDKSFYRVTSPRAGQAGYMLITPLKMKDGITVLVSRGWTPKGEEAKPKGTVQVTGVLRPLRGKRMFTPENFPEKNIWFYEDIGEMEKQSGLKLAPAIIEEVGPYQANTYPVPNDGKIILRNDHLGYAITWFAIMIAGLVMFAIYYREKPETLSVTAAKE